MGRKNLKYYAFGLADKIGRSILPRFKRKNLTLFRYTGALGDALFLTTVAREVKKRNPQSKVHIYTGLPEIFKNNPDVDRVTKYNDEHIPGLGNFLINYGHYFPWKKHILNYCALTADIKDDIDLKTYIYPDKADFLWAEKITSSLKNKIVLVNRKAGPRTDKKNWPDNYWEMLLPDLCRLYNVVEIGTGNSINDFNDPNYLNLLGKTTIHQTAALMSKADLLICPVTGLLHLASAFDLPTLCILGGSEPSVATKYPNTFYMEFRPPCANCYEKGPCIADFLCLKEIKPGAVLLKVTEIINEKNSPVSN